MENVRNLANYIVQQNPLLQQYSVVIEAILISSLLAEYIRTKKDYGQLIKTDESPVTIADLSIQMVLMKAISSVFPEDEIIAEEENKSLQDESIRSEIKAVLAEFGLPFLEYSESKKSSDRFWTIDPIDGTKGFLRNEQYAICVSLVSQGRVQFSIISCPNLVLEDVNEKGYGFVAVRGSGAYEFALSAGNLKKLEKRTDQLVGSVMMESYVAGHTSHQLSTGLREHFSMDLAPARLDSQCKYCLIAHGAGSLYLRKPKEGYVEKVWDHAPGALLIEEVGGQVTDFAGNPICFLQQAGMPDIQSGILASMYGAEKHQKLVEYLYNM